MEYIVRIELKIAIITLTLKMIILYNMYRKVALKSKGGHTMSTREYATELVNALSEEQVNTLCELY